MEENQRQGKECAKALFSSTVKAEITFFHQLFHHSRVFFSPTPALLVAFLFPSFSPQVAARWIIYEIEPYTCIVKIQRTQV